MKRLEAIFVIYFVRLHFNLFNYFNFDHFNLKHEEEGEIIIVIV